MVAVARNMRARNVANAKLTIADKFRPCYTAATGDETESERRGALLALELNPITRALPCPWRPGPAMGDTQVARGGLVAAKCEKNGAA